MNASRRAPRVNRVARACAVGSAVGIAGWILFACVGYDVPLVMLDDGGDADSDAGRTCTASMPFKSPVEVGGINTNLSEISPSLTSDEKTIVFTRQTDNTNAQLYMATRTSTDENFGAPILIPGISDGSSWTAMAQLSPSGDTMVFLSSPDSSAWKIYLTHRHDNGTFDAPTPIVDGRRPFLTSDGSELFFASTPTSTAESHLFRSLNSADGFSPPEPVPGLVPSDAYSDSAPVLSQDGLTMYFASTRPAPLATSSWQIYVTERQTRADSFGSVSGPINMGVGPEGETPGWLSEDGCRLYFEGRRNGTWDIFVASRL